jgi:hypothetical protein
MSAHGDGIVSQLVHCPPSASESIGVNLHSGQEHELSEIEPSENLKRACGLASFDPWNHEMGAWYSGIDEFLVSKRVRTSVGGSQMAKIPRHEPGSSWPMCIGQL